MGTPMLWHANAAPRLRLCSVYEPRSGTLIASKEERRILVRVQTSRGLSALAMNAGAESGAGQALAAQDQVATGCSGEPCMNGTTSWVIC